VNRDAPSPSTAEPPAPAALHGEALTAADSAWLRVDRDHNQMIITALLVLDDRLDYDVVQQRLAQRLRVYPRLSKRIVPPRFGIGAPRWEEDPGFHIHRQTERVQLPGAADQGALEGFIGTLMDKSFDPSHPLWRIYYVDNFVRAPHAEHPAFLEKKLEGAALVIRVHHCIADGIALLGVLLSLADEPPEIRFPTAGAAWAKSGGRASQLEKLQQWVGVTLRGSIRFLRFWTGRSDPKTRFRSPLGERKHAALSKPIPLARIKDIGRALGGTVNEVLISAAAGALGHAVREDATFHERLVMRGVVPVNLRGEEDLTELGNRFGLVFMPMPVGIRDAAARLGEVRRAMDDIKSSPEALGWFALLRALGRVPSWIEALGVELFSRKASLVITSLAGPPEALHFCGTKIDQVMFWVPSAGNVGLGMSMLTYDNEVQLGVATDANQHANPNEIVEAFEREIERLANANSQENRDT
jgi:diacylglycerol O-acyltransferase